MRMLSRFLLAAVLLLGAGFGPAATQSVQLFVTEFAAQKHCPSDIVVWANLPSRIYHFKGMRWYGNTKNGAYMCEKEADRAGYRATRNGQ